MEAGKECVICFDACAEFAPLCVKHLEHACYDCVMRLRRTKGARCPVCRAHLLNDSDAKAHNMTWEEFMQHLRSRMDTSEPS